jgi:hypothetical protein
MCNILVVYLQVCLFYLIETVVLQLFIPTVMLSAMSVFNKGDEAILL